MLQLALTLLFIGAGGFALSAQNSQDEVSVPKGIQDIEKMLKLASVDNKSRDTDIKFLATDPEPSATNEEKYIHYFLQSEAAGRLGRVDTRIAVLNKALPFIKTGTYQEFAVLGSLAGAEISVGLSKEGIQRRILLLSKLPPNDVGNSVGTNASLVNDYASMGDFETAEKHLRLSSAALVFGRRGPWYSVYGFNWNAGYFRAVGDLAFHKGKFQESQVAYKQAIDSLEGGIEQDEIRFNKQATAGVPGVGGNGANSGTPSNRKATLEALYIRNSDALLRLRKLNEAEYYAREAFKKTILRTGKSSIATATSLQQIAKVLLARDRSKDAIYLLNQSIKSLLDAGVTERSINLAVAKKILGAALISEDYYLDGLKTYSELETTLKNYPELSKFISLDSTDRVLALIRTGDLVSAENVAKRLVSLNEIRTGKSSRETTQSRLLLACALAEQRKDEVAQGLFSTSINNLIELERESSADSDGISMQEKKFLAGYVESYLGVLYRAFEKSVNQKLLTEAFVLGDLARSSNVQRALSASTARANITDQRLSKLVREEQDLNQQITFLTKFSKELAMQPASEQLPQIQAKMKSDIEQLRKDAKRATMLIALDFPEYAELVNPKPISLEKIQKTIKPNETLVTWFVGTKTSYVWAVNQQGAPLFKAIPVGQKEVRQNVAELRKALDAKVAYIDEIPAFDFQLSSRMFDELFKPVQYAFEGKDTLVVVPHDDIGQLPLGVLTTAPFQLKGKPRNLFSNYKEAPFLIRQYAIVSSPSVTALNALRGLPEPKKDRLDFIGFGDPLFSTQQAKLEEKQLAIATSNGSQLASRGVPLQLRNTPQTADVSSAQVSRLPRLPDTSDEILEISKLFNVKPDRDIFLQKRANLDQVLKVDMSNRKVVMFSTHGLMPGELDGLSQPALALTNPEVQNLKGDGLLKVDTILTMKLDADWVVLSACNTAAGEGEGAEALSGLGRAFFFAGARAILVSSWPVDSEASRKLMTDMFKHYVQDKGISKPRALQLASIRILDEGAPDDKEANYSYAHPLFWGPFTMVGN